MTELLSPAGGREALVAAVQNGADAVYMGFGSFNARRSARNFSDEEFLAAVRYCHLRGVKVYLTLNTLVTDRELRRDGAAGERIWRGRDIGAGLGRLRDAARGDPRCAAAREHTDGAAHALGCGGGGAARYDAGSARARAVGRGDPRDRGARADRDRGLCARGALYVLFGNVRDVRGDRRAERQPRRMREGGRESTVAQGRESRGVCRRDGGDGRDLPEARGAHEAARVCGGGDGHLCRAAARAPRTDGGRAEKACAGILTRRVHGRLLPRPAREGNVRRSPGNCAVAGGMVRHAAGGL